MTVTDLPRDLTVVGMVVMRGSRGGAKGALAPPPLPTKYCSPK